MHEQIRTFLQGVLLGGYYAIVAAGLSLMFGVVRFINLAHGDMTVLGATLTLFAVDRFGLPVLAGIALVLPVMAVFGWLMQRFLLERALAGDFLLPILVTIGPGAALTKGRPIGGDRAAAPVAKPHHVSGHTHPVRNGRGATENRACATGPGDPGGPVPQVPGARHIDVVTPWSTRVFCAA